MAVATMLLLTASCSSSNAAQPETPAPDAELPQSESFDGLRPDLRAWGGASSATVVEQTDDRVVLETPSSARVIVPLGREVAAESVAAIEYEGPDDVEFLRSAILDVDASAIDAPFLDEEATLEFPIPRDAQAETIQIVVLDELSGIWFPVESTVAGGTISTKTAQFSTWAVADSQVDGVDLVLHQMGRLLGSRARPPECQGYGPFWVASVLVEPGTGANLLVCATGDDRDRLVLRIVNNRPIAVRVEFSAPLEAVGPPRISQAIYDGLTRINNHVKDYYATRLEADAPKNWVFIPALGSVDVAFADPGRIENDDPRISSNERFGVVTGRAVYDIDTWAVHNLFVLAQFVPLPVIELIKVGRCTRTLSELGNGRIPAGGITDFIDCVEQAIKAMDRGASLSAAVRGALKTVLRVFRVVRWLIIDTPSNAYNVLNNSQGHDIWFRSKNNPDSPPVTQGTAERVAAEPERCRNGPGAIVVPGENGETALLELTENRFFPTEVPCPTDEESVDPGTSPTTTQTASAVDDRIYEPKIGDIRAVVDLGDGQLAIAGSGTVQVWDSTAPAHFVDPANPSYRNFDVHQRPIQAMVKLPDGRLLSTDWTGAAHLWGPLPESPRLVLPDRVADGSPVAVLPDDRVASVALDGTIEIWQPNDPDVRDTRYAEHEVEVTALIGLPGGSVVSGALDGGLRIWDGADGTTLALVPPHASQVTSLLLLSDGRLASAGRDGEVRIWDPDDPIAGVNSVFSRHASRSADFPSAMAELPDGRIISGGTDGLIYVWDPDAPDTEVDTYEAHNGLVHTIVVLDTGQIASTSDGTIQLWRPS